LYRFGAERLNGKPQKPNNIQILISNIQTLQFKKPNFFEKLGFFSFHLVKVGLFQFSFGKSWAFFYTWT